MCSGVVPMGCTADPGCFIIHAFNANISYNSYLCKCDEFVVKGIVKKLFMPLRQPLKDRNDSLVSYWRNV